MSSKASEPDIAENLIKKLKRKVGAVEGKRLALALEEASRQYDKEHFKDAELILRSHIEEYPNIAELHELLGLCSYKVGDFQKAVTHLSLSKKKTKTKEHNHLLMDSHRALGEYRQTEALWKETASAEVPPELLAEARMVMAGAYANQGRYLAGITLLEEVLEQLPKDPQAYEVLETYVLADLYEQAGDFSKARQLFGWVQKQNPNLTDAEERLTAL